MAAFDLKLTALDREIFAGPATYCRIVTSRGSLGLEARHEPLVACLKPDTEVVYTAATGQTTALHVRSGVLDLRNNRCLVLVDQA